jgi:hypothetical protein
MNGVCVGCDVGDLLAGNTAMVTGVEGDRIYLGARYNDRFVRLDSTDPDEREIHEKVTRAWQMGGHVLIPLWLAEGLLQGGRRNAFIAHR